MDTSEILRNVTTELTGEFGSRPIARERVLEWMRINDIQCMGAVYSLITEQFNRIQPPLQFAEYYPFVLTYLQRCVVEDPRVEWAETRYGAGGNIISWFVWAWRDADQRTATVAELKEWLASLYIAGDTAIRTCLVHATLEHLFENREVANYFSDWTTHPVLSTAYRDAMKWAEGGGRSPFWT